MTKVSIVIVNWNGYEDTIECLKSLEKISLTQLELSVVIVDNASTNDSVNEIANFIKNNDTYTLIVNKKNLGFAGGNNVGIKYALKNGADYIFLLNNDTIVDKNLLVQLVDTAMKHPEAGEITPLIYFAPGYEFHKSRYKKNELGKVIWSAGGKIDWGNVYGSNRGVDEVDQGQYARVEDVDFATGAAVLISAKALRKVGSFNEDYFLYFEDTDLSIRMKNKGWKVIVDPRAKLWHKVSQSSGIGSDLNDYFTTRNRLLFGMKYASLRTQIALFRESTRMLLKGRKWQKIGVIDYYMSNFGKGSWK